MDSQVAVKAVIQNADGKFLIVREGELKHIVALFFSCKTTSTEVNLSDEHQEYAWITADELEKYGDLIEREIKEAIILADM